MAHNIDLLSETHCYHIRPSIDWINSLDLLHVTLVPEGTLVLVRSSSLLPALAAHSNRLSLTLMDKKNNIHDLLVDYLMPILLSPDETAAWLAMADLLN